MLRNLDVVRDKIRFIPRERSRYRDRLSSTACYPIGVIGDGIELHFLHYGTAAEAAGKWERRVRRINPGNMIVKFCDRDMCTPELIGEFDRLPYEYKVCFTARPYPQYRSCCHIKEQSGLEEVRDYWTVSQKYWDVVKAANGMKGCPRLNVPRRAMLWMANRLVKHYHVKTD